MAMSGADGKRFTISKNNLSAAPLGGMMPQMNKILPPLLLGVVLVGGSYMLVKYLRGD
tara:strand:+ start:562 stop:735 length:174 start_codon:yes stop_codon:yes gene_type:complete